jgi:hypothetical protein
MFRPLVLCAFALVPAVAAAQPPGEANREAMKKLDYLAGKWKGEATTSLGPKETKTITQTEDVQFKLNGTVLLVEGVGRGKLPGKDEEGVLFNALGVMSYDAQAKKYKVKAYRMEGQSVDADLTLTEKGFVWGFKEPQRGVEVRYTMNLTAKGEWHEVGEYTLDGKAWTKFIEMTLSRVKEKP